MLQNPFSFRWATLKEKVIEGLDKHLTADLDIQDTGTERGRGVFATLPIQKHTYICEYRAHIRMEAEYEKLNYTANNEGSYVLERQVGRRKTILEQAQKILTSALTDWQKIEALNTFVLLMHSATQV